jgi:hypothetical protein
VFEEREKKAAPDTGRELHTRFRPGDCGSRGGEGLPATTRRRLARRSAAAGAEGRRAAARAGAGEGGGAG